MSSDRPGVRIRITASVAEIDLVDRLADAWLRSLAMAEGPRDRFLLAVREAVTNAVQHGAGLDALRLVEIDLERRNNKAVIRVKDDGGGFKLDDLPDPLAPENLMRASGRGILMMKALSDEIEFTFASGTQVELRKALTGEPQDLKEEEEE